MSKKPKQPKQIKAFDDDFDSAFDSLDGGKKKKGGYTFAPRCYEKHPTFKLSNGILCGGSCSHPIVADADIYVGVDSYMHFKTPQYPWNAAKSGGPIEVLFPISDMCAPTDVAEFKKMIDWLAQKLEQGKKIHVGCMGGHGRTGTVLAALVAQITDSKDAIEWVRKNYCKKAVESHSQVQFLVKHYGVNSVTGYKEGSAHTGRAGTGYQGYITGWGATPSERSPALEKFMNGGDINEYMNSLERHVTVGGDSGKKDLPVPKSKQGKDKPIDKATAIRSGSSIW